MTRDVAGLDARGLKCPWPALRVARAMRSHDRIAVTVDDPVAPREIAALAAEHDWEVKEESSNGLTIIRVSRAGQ